MKVEISVPEVVEIFNEIQQQPESLFEMIRVDLRQTVGEYLSSIMKAEMSNFLGREPYERQDGESNHRNGSYKRKFALKGIGEVKVKVPRDRAGKYNTQILPRSKQYEKEISRDMSMMFLAGISTRSLSMLSRRLIGRSISPTEISNVNSELSESVEKWRRRDLSQEKIKYIFIDGVNFPMRYCQSVELTPVLAAIGVNETGQKLVLSLQAGDKESSVIWREFFKDLKERGLDGSVVQLGIMDGLPGLEKVFREEFSNARVQRCQVHVARNILAKVPKKQKEIVADGVRSIFYASSKKKALELYENFISRWGKDLPSAVACLDRSLDSCLTFFSFPQEEWISLRTTNVIERLNKEFKRRTKPMEIVAGEDACYRLLAFISLRMELHWRSNPIGKVGRNLPNLKKLAWNNFTQKS
ncbi:IS256 family transposase [Desulfomarina sp.]